LVGWWWGKVLSNQPHQKIKVLDLVIKKKVKELEEEFEQAKGKKDYQLFRIDPKSGRKTRVKTRS